jgi:predicted TIM-barrel fold metal-dependent hydrolase
MPADAWDRSLGGKFDEGQGSLCAQLEFMTRVGIAASVVYPTRSLSLGMIREPKAASAIMNAYNELVLEYAAGAPAGAVRAAALCTPTCLAESVRKTEAWKKDGYAALTLLPHGHDRLLGEPEFFDLYEACEAVGLPICLHPNSNGIEGLGAFKSFVEVHTCAVPFILIRQLISLVFGGVFERFPKLRWLLPEAGCNWLLYWIERMDGEYRLRREETELSRPPAELLASIPLFVSAAGPEADLDRVDAALGGGVVWASDYPHWDHSGLAHVDDLRASIPEPLFRRISWDNAISLYGAPL